MWYTKTGCVEKVSSPDPVSRNARIERLRLIDSIILIRFIYEK